MKKILFLAAVCGSLLLLNSCGTITYAIKKGKAPVFMCTAPNDLQVSVDGVKQEIESEVFAASATSNTTTSYYTAAVNLPHKHKATLELYSPSSGKRAKVDVRPKMWGKLLFLDIIFFEGWIVDLPLGNLTTLKPRLIDVERALDGKPRNEWRSQGKLKRMTKRKIKRGH